MRSHLDRGRRGSAGAVAAALLALALIGGAAFFTVAVGLPGLAAPVGAGPDGERVSELLMAARASQRFGLGYPTPAAGWRAPGLARPIVSRPPGTDLAVRAAFEAAGAQPAAARAVALGATVLALLALARLAWIGWGPWAGVAAAALFALLPYTARYADFPDGGMPALAAMAMALGSFLRFRRGRAPAAAAGALVFMFVGGLFDWSAYLLMVPLAVAAYAGSALQGRYARARPQELGLPEGLSGPLANILMRREGATALALTNLLAALAAAELVLFLVWYVKLGVVSAFFATLGGAGAEAPVAAAVPGPLAASLFGAVGVAVVALWTVATVARLVLGQSEAGSVAPGVLLIAAALFAVLFPEMARGSFHLPALAAGGVVLAAIDLATVAGALGAARRLVLPAATPRALGVSAGVLALVAIALVPGFRRARAAAAAAGGEAQAERTDRAFARLVNDQTAVGDRLLVLRGFPLPLRFLAAVDRDVQVVPTLAGLEELRDRDPHTVAVFAEPLTGDDEKALTPLLQRHPAARLDGRWLIDLRRYEPGIRSFSATGGALVPRPREALTLDVAHGVWPSLDYLPEIGGDQTLTRDELFAYYNLHNARGPNPERERVRAKLLEGFEALPHWFDPAPLGLPAGLRWAAHERRLDLVWECTGAPLAMPFGVSGARFVFRPADHDWRATAFDRPIGPPCGANQRPGELHEQSFTFKLPFRGRYRVAVQLLRDSRGHRPLNPAPVELGIIDASPRE